jgi:hypothetical protein
MSSHQSRRAPRDTVEQLLDEVPGTTPAEAGALSALFLLAAAPTRPGELAGEAAAVAAFRSAHRLTAHTTRKETSMKRSIARLLTVKAAAVAVAVTSMGGVALASTTGVGPLTHDSHKSDQAVAAKAAAVAAKTAGEQAKDAAKTLAEQQKAAAKAAAVVLKAAEKAAETDVADAAEGQDYTASYAGLCHAYFAGNKATHGNALNTKPFLRLIAASGPVVTEGVNPVTTFCDALAAVTPVVAPATATATEAEGVKAAKVANDHATAGKAGAAEAKAKAAAHKAAAKAKADAKAAEHKAAAAAKAAEGKAHAKA